MTSAVDAKQRPQRVAWRAASAVAVALSVIALYVWDDALFAAPVVAMTAWRGPAIAFVVFATLYSAGSYVLAVWAVRAYDRMSSNEPSRLAVWLRRQSEARRSGWGRRLLDSGRVVGFVLSSFLLGGILTTWFIRYGGRERGIHRIAAASCLIFGVTFTAMYTGIAGALLSL